MRFIHAADVHLDSPLLRLNRYDGAPVEAFRSATRRAFENLVGLAIEEKVDFVLIAGDLYDGECKDMNTPIDARMAEKAEQLQNLDIRELVNSVENLDDAYRIAYDLESSEVNAIFNFLTIRFLSSDESYDIISATIDRHLLRLADFSRTFGDAEQCKQIAAIS